jgi:uncharacterized protein (TIGR00369 family)
VAPGKGLPATSCKVQGFALETEKMDRFLAAMPPKTYPFSLGRGKSAPHAAAKGGVAGYSAVGGVAVYNTRSCRLLEEPTMERFTPADPQYAERVRTSFERQQVMHTIGGMLVDVTPGMVLIELPFNSQLTQQHGFLHAGIVTTIVDSACGYAAYSLMPVDAAVLTIEYKINLIAPAAGERFIARGEVIKPGRNITVCEGRVTAISEGREQLIALMQATMMTLRERPGLAG